mmetsp:Transcript_67419/g.110844  ORF Transcript_67419/g.110844 Transcript_67419/m.110844 type:complete len:246 (-) Transcript_67419:13-750(-)
MPLVLRPKTFPMEMFQPKCHPKAKPKRPPVRRTLRPPAMPPTKMLSMLRGLVPPGDGRCITTKNTDSNTMAKRKAAMAESSKYTMPASARLYKSQPRTGSSSLIATFKWKTTSQKIHTQKFSDGSKTSKNCKKTTQPAISSTPNMNDTIVMPTAKPMMLSTKKAPSRVKPNKDKDRLSMHTDMNHTPRSAPMPMPNRMHASLQRWRPVTWFRKKGWPVLDLYFCNSFGSSMAGHAIRVSWWIASS